MAVPHLQPSALRRWWWRVPTWTRLLAGIDGVLIVLVVVAVIIGAPPPPRHTANTVVPTTTPTPDHVVQSGSLCPTEARIEANDAGVPLICSPAKDGKLRWRRV